MQTTARRIATCCSFLLDNLLFSNVIRFLDTAIFLLEDFISCWLDWQRDLATKQSANLSIARVRIGKIYSRAVPYRGSWLWFKSYLSSRRQCVHINNSRSSLLPVISGVPQGSILGPLLFLIYVNDLPLSINSSSLLLFADDTKCLKSIDCPHDCDLLQNDLSLLSDWSLKWKLLFNVFKCVNLTFSLSQDPIVHSYFINDK